jgi:membrane-associated phospholipid phosphatase
LKDIVHQARPLPDLVGVFAPLSDPSFPSGHVVQYTTLFGVAFFLVYVLAEPCARGTVALVLLALPIALIGPSRLYLGQHWLSDVLGGYAEAALLLVPTVGRMRGGVWMPHVVDSRTDPASPKHPWPIYCSKGSYQA